jgi:hypothetical protein
LNDNIKEIGSALADTNNASCGKRRIKKFATEDTEDTEKSSLTPLTPLNSLTYPHGFNDRGHNIRVFMDNVYDRISVILDGKLVFENIPRDAMAYFSPAISFSFGPDNASEVEIDDVFVRAFYSLENEKKWFTLFFEDFGRLKKKNDLGNCGWRTKSERTVEGDQLGSRKSVFANHDQGTELKTLRIKSCEDNKIIVSKSFNIPIDFPFDISDKTFEIRYNNDMYTDVAAYDDAFTGNGVHGPSLPNFYSSSSTTLSNSTPGISRTSEMYNTYYLYTFDGKLLAEYDHNGNCVQLRQRLHLCREPVDCRI